MDEDEEWSERYAASGLTDWHVQESQAHTTIGCGSFSAAGELAARLARVCDELGHHAEIDIRPPDQLRVTTWTHDSGGLSDQDLRLARALQRVVDEPPG
jgi:4a-hydroxytetrahydrobiopterin dehydratase